ncbi:MAG: prepilin peptidase [bacterium]|nr:prepilin peptidase [bacterium]
MQFFYYIITFILGTAVGSFINNTAERLYRGEKINGRSHCEHCNKTLSASDLVPLFSYIFLKGKCRYCHTNLPKQYIIIEIITGIIFTLIYHLVSTKAFVSADYLNNSVHFVDFGIFVPLIFFYIVTTSLLILFITDFKYGMLYDKVVLPTILFVFCYRILVIAYNYFHIYSYLNKTELGQYFIRSGLALNRVQFSSNIFLYTLLGSIAIASFFLLLIIITKGRGMGGGDLKLGFLIGLLSGWPNMVISIFIGFLTGAVVSCILLLVRKRTVGQTIPFGPFLILGCFIVMFFGDQLFGWYINDILGLR